MNPLFLHNSIFTAVATHVVPILSSGRVSRTLDILLYALVALGVVLIAGIVGVFIWEYRKFQRFFKKHKFM